MKEFVEKLIGRLEEEREISYADFYEYLMKYELYNDFDEDDDWFYKGLIRAISIVNQLTEEYNNGWIPCSERLPEVNQKVLTCDKDGWISVNVNMPYMGVRNDFKCGYYVAWMPLPAPYQKGE